MLLNNVKLFIHLIINKNHLTKSNQKSIQKWKMVDSNLKVIWEFLVQSFEQIFIISLGITLSDQLPLAGISTTQNRYDQVLVGSPSYTYISMHTNCKESQHYQSKKLQSNKIRRSKNSLTQFVSNQRIRKDEHMITQNNIRCITVSFPVDDRPTNNRQTLNSTKYKDQRRKQENTKQAIKIKVRSLAFFFPIKV